MSAPRLRLIAGRPVSEPERPQDGITFFERALKFCAGIILALLAICLIAVVVLSLGGSL